MHFNRTVSLSQYLQHHSRWSHSGGFSLLPHHIPEQLCLSPEGQQVSQPSQEFPHVSHVVVKQLGKVVVHQGAVESSATDADHHGGQAHEQQDEAGVPAHHIWRRRSDRGQALVISSTLLCCLHQLAERRTLLAAVLGLGEADFAPGALFG